MTDSPQAVARIGTYEWPIQDHADGGRLLDGVGDSRGVEFDPRPHQIDALVDASARSGRRHLRNTSNPTVLDAGYKPNVIPGRARRPIDVRPCRRP